MKFTLYIKNTNARYIPRHIINTTLDICAMLNHKMSNPFFDHHIEDLKKYSNYGHPCPFSVSYK